MTDWIIDATRFAERRDTIEAELSIADLPRLADEAIDSFVPVRVHVEGVRSPRGKPGLRARLEATVTLQCQRCMRPVDVRLAPDSHFELVGSERELDADEDDQWDLLVASDRLDLRPVLEDELLLALPFAPMHETCDSGAQADAGEKVMPFAALAQLKRGA